MAISELERPTTTTMPETVRRREAEQISAARYYAMEFIHALASLKLTVVLFALSIFLVFVATLAQVDNDVWDVVRHKYFQVWIAHVKFQAFDRLGQLFYRPFTLGLPEWAYFPFPGGNTLGLALFVNLLAAHAVRFRVAASGRRLIVGVGVIALGALVTLLVIQSGVDRAIESELSPRFAMWLSYSLKGALAIAVFIGVNLLVMSYARMGRVEWILLAVSGVLFAALAVWLLAQIDTPGLRIMWQLVKGTGAGLVLLAGCILVFRRRAGIVVLHGGVALMMLSEMLTGINAKETQMTIPEGGSANWSQDIRTAELAVTDRSDANHDEVTVVPQPFLVADVKGIGRIKHNDLPFEIDVRRWMPNARLVEPVAGKSNVATAGAGLFRVAEEVAGSTGVETESNVNLPAAYVELFEKGTEKSLGTYLVSHLLNDQPVEVNGTKYDLSLRFERTYHPFNVHLKDFAKKDYVGTDTPKSFESLVQITDPAQNVDREVLIWMNNPLRYSGLTFYQSSFDQDTEATTVLQVVRNPNWMAPYVSWSLVMIGMAAHFGTMLVRFLQRRSEESGFVSSNELIPVQNGRAATNGASRRAARRERQAANTSSLNWGIIVPILTLVVFGGYLASKARMPKSDSAAMQIYEFGKLPVQYQGRVKPYDTVARNTLQYLSGRQEVIREVAGGKTEKTPAIVWLLDTVSGKDEADDHRVFRIENLELLDTLGLEPRKGSFRYSLNDFRENIGELDKQARLAAGVPEKQRSLYQRKVAELYEKLQLYAMLQQTFGLPQLASGSEEEMRQSLDQVQLDIQRLRNAKLPLAIPPTKADVHWSGLMDAGFTAILARELKQPVNPATLQLYAILNAYAKNDSASFNRDLTELKRTFAQHEQLLVDNRHKLEAASVKHSEIYGQRRVNFETFFNNFSPFYYAAVLYLVAFVLGAASWLGWSVPLRRASIWLLCFTLVVHTFALWGRMHISGRPPVTNLYSSAIFIGWGCVVLGLVLEFIYKLGLGNIVAAAVGFLTLVVAHFLSLDGDTLIVMQAVLDTQFWLATHVVCITLGYATTFIAGAFGICYILLAHVFPVLQENERRQLTRMIYGSVCFAIFFSFVGTVLGGLWADDSWGRFWGWDPKENGALIIVLYNALVLHARFGGMVKGRGLATLVIGGNIVTTWSWFGVNELGVGLHAYGASESSTAMWLLTFAVSQLALIALGMMPQRWFHSQVEARAVETA